MLLITIGIYYKFINDIRTKFINCFCTKFLDQIQSSKHMTICKF